MREYVSNFLDKYDYDKAYKAEILECYNKLNSKEFEEIISLYKTEKSDVFEIIRLAKEYFDKKKVNEFRGYLVLFICLSKRLKEIYLNKGISEEDFDTSISDLKYEAETCNLKHGIFGIDCAEWEAGWFTFIRIGYKKLQFQIEAIHRDLNEYGLKKDDLVIWVHIPRTGGKLDREVYLKEYKRASEHFRKYFGLKEVYFVCKTWLFFERHKEVLSPSSNLMQFKGDFTIIEYGNYENYKDAWRLFDTLELDPDKLPKNTSLQRFYVDLIRKGEPLGWGLGFFKFEE